MFFILEENTFLKRSCKYDIIFPDTFSLQELLWLIKSHCLQFLDKNNNT